MDVGVLETIIPYIRVPDTPNIQHYIYLNGGNVVIPVIRKYQRLTNYGLDPLGKPSYEYTKDTAYGLRLTTYFTSVSRR